MLLFLTVAAYLPTSAWSVASTASGRAAAITHRGQASGGAADVSTSAIGALMRRSESSESEIPPAVSSATQLTINTDAHVDGAEESDNETLTLGQFWNLGGDLAEDAASGVRSLLSERSGSQSNSTVDCSCDGFVKAFGGQELEGSCTEALVEQASVMVRTYALDVCLQLTRSGKSTWQAISYKLKCDNASLRVSYFNTSKYCEGAPRHYFLKNDTLGPGGKCMPASAALWGTRHKMTCKPDTHVKVVSFAYKDNVCGGAPLQQCNKAGVKSTTSSNASNNASSNASSNASGNASTNKSDENTTKSLSFRCFNVGSLLYLMLAARMIFHR